MLGCAWCGDLASENLGCGGFHLVFTQVVPADGAADKEGLFVKCMSVVLASAWSCL